MTFRPTRILAALTFGLALTLLLPGYAPAQPTTDIHAKAAQLEKDLNAANQKVETLGEQLQAAQAKVDAMFNQYAAEFGYHTPTTTSTSTLAALLTPGARRP